MDIYFTQGSDGLTKAATKPPMQTPNFPDSQEKVIAVLDITKGEWEKINALKTVDSREISQYLEQHTPLKWHLVWYRVWQQVRELIDSLKSGFDKREFIETHRV